VAIGDLNCRLLWRDMVELLDALQKLFTILAIIAGGVWAYFHYFRRRTYRLRLEPKVSGTVIFRDGMRYLIATAQLKNVGLSKARIEQRGTALRVYAYYPSAHTLSACRCVNTIRIATFPVFEHHEWIESGELIEDQRLIAMPSEEQIAFLVELRLVSRKISWRTTRIIELPSKP
jgi:hypothetical protein